MQAAFISKRNRMVGRNSFLLKTFLHNINVHVQGMRLFSMTSSISGLGRAGVKLLYHIRFYFHSKLLVACEFIKYKSNYFMKVPFVLKDRKLRKHEPIYFYFRFGRLRLNCSER